MKRLLLIPLVFFLSSCSNNNYSSRTEAKIACKKWSEEGFLIVWDSIDYLLSDEPTSRWCVFEKETRQYLGFSYYQIKKGEKYPTKNDIPKNKRVMKRFLY